MYASRTMRVKAGRGWSISHDERCLIQCCNGSGTYHVAQRQPYTVLLHAKAEAPSCMLLEKIARSAKEQIVDVDPDRVSTNRNYCKMIVKL